jgi:glycosyltransferase involved in cell wall biosynthesis
MINNPLFSIIIVTFNTEKFIENTINSVLGQDLKDFEVIIKDGLSQDNTLNLITNDSRIKVVSCADDGIYDAMNQAIKFANGEFIVFINSGDKLYHKSTLSNISHLAIKYKDTNTILYGDIFTRGKVQYMPKKYSSYRSYKKTICHQALFYNRSIFGKMTGYNTDYKIAADYEHLLRCKKILKCKIIHTEVIVSFYQGGGFSEKIENVKQTKLENNDIRIRYFNFITILFFKSINNIVMYFLKLFPKSIKHRIKNFRDADLIKLANEYDKKGKNTK